MKFNLDSGNENLTRARNLSKNKEVSDLEESIRLLKIHSSSIQPSIKKTQTLFEIFEVSFKLTSQLEFYEKKFWQFKMSTLLLVEILKCAKGQKSEDLEKTKQSIINSLKDLFNLFGSQKLACFEFYSSNNFKKMISDKFGDSLMINFLNSQNSEIAQSILKNFPKNDDIYLSFKVLVDTAFREIQNDVITLRPVSSEYFVPISPEGTSDDPNNDGFDKQFFDEFASELKSKLFQGKEAFFRFLLKYYQIEMKNGILLREFDPDVLTYSKEIVNFFFNSQFTDPTEKQIVKMVQNGLRQMRWL